MSSTLIRKFTDFEFIINDGIYLSGSSFGVKEEIYNNMWQISFDEKMLKTIIYKDLKTFFDALSTKRSEQVAQISSASVATLYLWFDVQSSQLCFNLLSGKNIELPFDCTVNVVASSDIILNKCINEAQNSAITWDQVEIIEPGDPSWDDDEDDDPKKYILDVYVTILPGK